ncbi:MAG: hypothetical protein ACI83N_000734 [Hydrogenophaga sp.]|jgi:hypothetical protein
MRFRPFRRRLAHNTPRMSVRSALPWPFRWLLGAVVIGFSGALALWAFEFGKDIAGLDRNAKQELEQLRGELVVLHEALGKSQLVSNTSDSLLTAERVAQEQIRLQLRQLEIENQTLRNDLGFFERMMPGTGSAALDIRGLQVERVAESKIRWQALMIQPTKNAPEFKGTLEITFTGTQDGQPWSTADKPRTQGVVIRGYLREEGLMEVPPSAVVKTVTARLLQGGAVKSVHTVRQ